MLREIIERCKATLKRWWQGLASWLAKVSSLTRYDTYLLLESQGTTMLNAKLSQAAMAAMIAARGTPEHKPLVKRLFAEAKRHYGIPAGNRLRADIDDKSSRDYGVLIRKRNNQRYSVRDDLVPFYVFGPKFVRVDAVEAVAALQQAAYDHGHLYATSDLPNTITPMQEGGQDYLVVNVSQDDTALYYRVELQDALALLAMMGEPDDHDYVPQGMGGVLSVGSDLLIPA